MLKKAMKHFITITKHKWIVLKLCIKAGIPYRGLVHDLSKYSPTEFWESAKYYTDGKCSPIVACKKKNGYSKAWLHHKGANKHHHEYWYDYRTMNPTPMIPYKYTVEMICDTLAAGMNYNGTNWNNSTQLNYWNNEKDKVMMNENLKDLLTEVYTQVSVYGIDKTIRKENLKQIYEKYSKKVENKI